MLSDAVCSIRLQCAYELFTELMETVPMKNFGWNDSEAPFYHGYLLPAVESFLPPLRAELFWTSAAVTDILSTD